MGCQMGRILGLAALAVVFSVTGLSVCGTENGSVNTAAQVAKLTSAGLIYGFYAKTCPTMETIVASRVAAILQTDVGVAPGLLRLFFHDCFVQGCDGSILLKLSSGTELNAVPNQTIRNSALQLVDDVKTRVESVCAGIVSCADIVVVAAKEAVQQTGGPVINVPLGRRDSLQIGLNTTDLPSPVLTFAQQSALFTGKGLNTTDLVALSGAHTLGTAHCNAFSSRLYPIVDPLMNLSYAGYLKANVCPSTSSNASTGMDFYSPNRFDNQYFKNLPSGGALLPSDENLNQSTSARSLVNLWARNQTDFFNQFISSFVKMSQIQPLTGTSGEIRKLCSTINSGSTLTQTANQSNNTSS